MDMELFWTVVRANGFCFMAVVLLYIMGRAYFVYWQRVRHAKFVKQHAKDVEEGRLQTGYVLGPDAGRPSVVAFPPGEPTSGWVSTYLNLCTLAERKPQLGARARNLLLDVREFLTDYERKVVDHRVPPSSRRTP